MAQKDRAPLAVAVSARALFDLEASHRIFVERGFDAYLAHVRASEEDVLAPGVAFPLVRALLRLNEIDPAAGQVVEVVVTSSIHPDAGLRIIASMDHYALGVRRAAFTGGSPVVPYLKAFGVDLLLSKSPEDAQAAVDGGIAAAVMYDVPSASAELEDGGPIRIAFDGDAVIFSEESEALYKREGLEAFLENEKRRAREPMADGPFARLLRTIQTMQKAAPKDNRPFRVSLVTARGGNAKERVLRTLRAWDIEIDEAYFLNGLPKDQILATLRPHIFFDDQDVHCAPASRYVPSGRVPYRGGTLALAAAPQA